MKPKKFVVIVLARVLCSTDVLVEADSKEEAEEKGLSASRTGSHIWEQCDPAMEEDYEIESVTKL